MALAIVPLLGALGAVPETLLMRSLDFGKRFGSDLAIALAKLAIAIGLVLSGAGIWAIVGAQIASVALRSASRWIMAGWWPRAVFDRALAASMLGFGWPIFVAGAIGVAVGKVDQLVVASLLGTTQLGLLLPSAPCASGGAARLERGPDPSDLPRLCKRAG